MNEIISCVDGLISKISGRELVSSSEMVDALLDIRLLAELHSVSEGESPVLENIQ
jgi:hypothetical protein